MTQPSAPYFQNVAGQVTADPAGFLRLTWSAQSRQLTDTQALFGGVAAGLRRLGTGCLLVDQTLMPPFTAAELHWFTREWLPGEGRASGYRCGAIVLAHNVLSRLATASITTDSQREWLRYRSFDTVEAATTWLLLQ